MNQIAKEHPGPVATTGRRLMLIVVVAAVVLAGLVGCSDSNSDNSAPPPASSEGSPGQGPVSTEVAEAGGGDVAGSCWSGAYPCWDPRNEDRARSIGSLQRPIDAGEFSPPSAGLLRKSDTTVCAQVETAHKTAFNRFGTYAYFTGVFLKGDSTNTVYALVCSDVSTETRIDPWTTGPGRDGVTLPCPPEFPYVYADSGAVSFKEVSSSGLGPSVSFTQAAGSHGRNNDGLFNYKFTNWTTDQYKPWLSLLCKK